MLVSYSDSESEGEPSLKSETVIVSHTAASSVSDTKIIKRPSHSCSQPPDEVTDPLTKERKRRKLPVVDLSGNGAKDGSSAEMLPAMKCKGDWLCHAFLEVHARADLTSLLHKASKDGRSQLQGIRETEIRQGESTLHVSLTRPILVRPHERQSFVLIVKEALNDVAASTVSFARFAHLINEDESRGFIAVEISVGHDELQTMSSRLDSYLRTAFKARPYYAAKRFHFSFLTADLSTSCAPVKDGTTHDKLVKAQMLSGLARDLEGRYGPSLRALPPLRLSRLGIRVGSQVHWVTLVHVHTSM
ncbi:hypothetical protein K437DRAFT_275255 [Tilletiaria anomala UBC 951]|uniref:U6 snRNA phosphodiesterase 1 n=1 Tax=Tilletiaria anomala (strain ATCC 24038 / CBS 436.72 / UBC 951) TaxID=1037660 RepID=A0A066VK12_TILAU|nr:uncharacterized protein K437DRAFT_275255 [Tilletiaria anomala UBC 951]KDN42077.1 hypothetical protein K437DRAFT_275255 [Tilletiaria anomala UBC 951]